jgi:seryl-tRNA synthetase
MRSGERLNQIEPLVAEMLIKLDSTAAKVDEATKEISLLKLASARTIEIVIEQSDNISFLIEGQRQLASKVDNLTARVDKIEVRLDKIELRLDNIELRLDKIEVRLDKMD